MSTCALSLVELSRPCSLYTRHPTLLRLNVLPIIARRNPHPKAIPAIPHTTSHNMPGLLSPDQKLDGHSYNDWSKCEVSPIRHLLYIYIYLSIFLTNLVKPHLTWAILNIHGPLLLRSTQMKENPNFWNYPHELFMLERLLQRADY